MEVVSPPKDRAIPIPKWPFYGLKMGGDSNHLLNGMILQEETLREISRNLLPGTTFTNATFAQKNPPL